MTDLVVSPEGLVRCPDCGRHVIAAADPAQTRCPFCAPAPGRSSGFARLARGGVLAAAMLGVSSPVVACYGGPGMDFDPDALADAAPSAPLSQDPAEVADTAVALSGVVVDAVSGEPIAGAFIAVDGELAVRTRDDGSWVVTRAQHFSTLAPGAPVVVAAAHPDFASAELALQVPGNHERDLVLALTRLSQDADATD